MRRWSRTSPAPPRRRPNTDDLGQEQAGVLCDKPGFIKVDDRLQTSRPGVCALGDCSGRGAFSHTAYNDFEIVAANLLGGDDRRVSSRVSGDALFINPPLSRVGITDAEAAKSGRPLLHSKRRMARGGPRRRKRRNQGVHEDCLRRRDQANSRSGGSRYWGRLRSYPQCRNSSRRCLSTLFQRRKSLLQMTASKHRRSHLGARSDPNPRKST